LIYKYKDKTYKGGNAKHPKATLAATDSILSQNIPATWSRRGFCVSAYVVLFV